MYLSQVAGDLFQNLTHLQEQLQEKERKEADFSREKENFQNQMLQKEEYILTLRSEIQRLTIKVSILEREREKQYQNIRETRRQKASVETQLRYQVKAQNQRLREMEQELARRDESSYDWIIYLQEKERKEAKFSREVENFQNQMLQKEEYILTLLREIRWLTNKVSILEGKREKQYQKVRETCRQKASVETQLRDQVEAQKQRLREMERQLAQREKSSYDWIISRSEVQVTDKRLGTGGWGTVYEGRYCGCAVAVKQIHEEIVSPYRLKMFQREIDMASKCRHPCLLQFIGATIDGEFPLLVTELMETSLRRLLKERPLSIGEVSIISLDVARALNYLHRKRPVPMIHRDISSANVLLWRKAGRETGIQEAQWRGKVSDYGTAKFLEEVMTQNPGAFVYSAPEGRTTIQTTKVSLLVVCRQCTLYFGQKSSIS